MIDLWPNELSTVDQRSPLTILKEQASLLAWIPMQKKEPNN